MNQIIRISLASIFNFVILCDVAEPYDLYFQETASPIAEGIVELHDHILYFLIIILIAVAWMLFTILNRERVGLLDSSTQIATPKMYRMALKDLNHGSVIEVIWTVMPAFILVAIAFPSFKLLYLMDEIVEPAITLKSIGHQWYWSYELTDCLDQVELAKNFDSYMVPSDSLEPGQLRLLEVDNRVFLPTHTVVRVITTSSDVIHSFAVPSLGIKIDAIPGRLNQAAMDILREGVFRGQCSELCGVSHLGMPIVIEAVSMDRFISWVTED